PAMLTYDGFVLIGEPEFVVFKTGSSVGDNTPVADIYIRARKQKPIRLHELTIDQFRNLRDSANALEFVEMTDHPQTFENKAMSRFAFHEGKLESMTLRREGRFEFSAKEEGPYVSLPMTKEEAISAFGRPLRSGYDKPSAGP